MHGVSTRSVDDLVKAMGMTGISKSQVSRLCREIDGKIAAFLNRPLEGDWPYLWLDATYVKVRASGRIGLSRGHRRRCRQQRRPARGTGHRDRRLRGGNLLDRVPTLRVPALQARSARRQAGDLGCP